jgi:bifunctional DNA-binding transcriptional regulator/antitoxin component of YhaV-PrlF toxin-antitoxin module
MRYYCSMKKQTTMVRISRGGQVTVPATVRHRWETERLALEDHGGYLLLRPLADPIDGFVGFAAGGGGPASEEMRAQSRAEEAAAEARRRR